MNYKRGPCTQYKRGQFKYKRDPFKYNRDPSSLVLQKRPMYTIQKRSILNTHTEETHSNTKETHLNTKETQTETHVYNTKKNHLKHPKNPYNIHIEMRTTTFWIFLVFKMGLFCIVCLSLIRIWMGLFYTWANAGSGIFTTDTPNEDDSFSSSRM